MDREIVGCISFSRGSSWPVDWTWVSCIGRRILYHWTTREALTKSLKCEYLQPPLSPRPRSVYLYTEYMFLLPALFPLLDPQGGPHFCKPAIYIYIYISASLYMMTYLELSRLYHADLQTDISLPFSSKPLPLPFFSRPLPLPFSSRPSHCPSPPSPSHCPSSWDPLEGRPCSQCPAAGAVQAAIAKHCRLGGLNTVGLQGRHTDG